MLISYNLMAVAHTALETGAWAHGYGKRGGKRWWRGPMLIVDGTY
jgi:hypothetical protein